MKSTFFGPNVKFLRKLNRYTQGQLGDAVGLTRNNIASYESGLVEPNLTNFLKIVNFFNVDAQEILTKSYAENPSSIHGGDNVEKDVLSQYKKEQFDEFTKKTTDISKIVEGYKTYYKLISNDEATAQEKDMHSSLNSILDMMQKLVSTNWQLIQSMYQADED